MPTLRTLDGQTVAVALAFNGAKVTLRGTAQFLSDEAVLRIAIQDATGNFDLLIKEDQWQGIIQKSSEPDCPYLIQLTAPCFVSG